MILAAGLGTRLLPLTRMRAKPALPVRGVPLVAYALRWLKRQGVTEVIVNLHHLPETVEQAVDAWCPDNLALRFSHERTLLDVGGGIRRVAHFLRESDPSLVIAGDMLVDFDLAPVIARHQDARRRATLVLRDDPRMDRFGSIGIDDQGCIRRIATRQNWGGETRAGLYTSVNLFSPTAFDSLPDLEHFRHLDGWLAKDIDAGAEDIHGDLVKADAMLWEPVGTLAEYLQANLARPALRYWDGDREAIARGTRFRGNLILGAGAQLGEGARLERAVVWDGERVVSRKTGSRVIVAGGEMIGVEGQ